MRIELELGWRQVLVCRMPFGNIIRCQWCQLVLNELVILGVRNTIRKFYKMNEDSVIVVRAHHDALILPYEF
jgi:hypothetical protein